MNKIKIFLPFVITGLLVIIVAYWSIMLTIQVNNQGQVLGQVVNLIKQAQTK